MTRAEDGAGSPPLGAGSLSFDRVAGQYDGTRGYPPGVSDDNR